MQSFVEQVSEEQQLAQELALLAIASEEEPEMEDGEELTPRKLSPEESTHYQTHHSHLFSLSPQHPRPHPLIKRNSLLHSTSPVRPKLLPSRPHPDLMATQILPRRSDHPFTGFRMEPVVFSPEKNERQSFRSRLMRSQVKVEEVGPVSAASWVAMWDSGELLGEKGGAEHRQIASLTKIMTALTVLRICQEYGIRIREHYIPILRGASFMEGTSANLRSGEEILIVDLLFGLLLPSGNDAGVALAQYFGKFLSFKFAQDDSSNDRQASNLQRFHEYRAFYDQQYQADSIRLFVFEMNKLAHSLGLTHTQFTNPTGLTHAGNYSSARDVAALCLHCLQNHTLRMIFRRKVHRCEVRNDKLGYNREVTWRNTNRHLHRIRECIGIKTGITPGAGPCLATAYRIGHRELVVIVLSSASLDDRYKDAEELYKWARRRAGNTQ